MKSNTGQASESLRLKIQALEEPLKANKIGVWEESDEEGISGESEND